MRALIYHFFKFLRPEDPATEAWGQYQLIGEIAILVTAVGSSISYRRSVDATQGGVTSIPFSFTRPHTYPEVITVRTCGLETFLN